MRILSYDPGPVNYGFHLGEFVVKKDKIVCNTIDSGQYDPEKLELAFTKGNDTKKQLEEFSHMVKGHMRQLIHSDHFVLERFQYRGVGHKNSIMEKVSIMNGVCLHMAITLNINIHVVTAATWKRQVQDLKSLYTLANDKNVSAHVLDAMLLGNVTASKILNLPFNNNRPILQRMIAKLRR